jgi:aryl-alcohol dehydrogenase-like predicted oxidoreductase
MEYTLLGRTGVRVSRLALGTATFGVAPQEKDTIKLVHKALDLGINFFDTAVTYGNQPRFDRPGAPPAHQRKAAEEILGMALQGHRDDVIIASKVQERLKPGPNGGGPDGAGLSRLFIMQQIERTLRRLGTDHLEIYYAHHPDPSTPMDHTIRAFDDLIHQGKVLYWALSTYPAWQLTEAVLLARQHGWYEPVCHQIGYNLTARQVERRRRRKKFGIGHTVFSPLAGGLLTGLKATACHCRRAAVDGWRARTAEHLAVAEQMEALGRSGTTRPATSPWRLLSRPTTPAPSSARRRLPSWRRTSGRDVQRCRADGRWTVGKRYRRPPSAACSATRWRMSQRSGPDHNTYNEHGAMSEFVAS